MLSIRVRFRLKFGLCYGLVRPAFRQDSSRVSGFGFQVSGFGFGFRVSGLGFRGLADGLGLLRIWACEVDLEERECG